MANDKKVSSIDKKKTSPQVSTSKPTVTKAAAPSGPSEDDALLSAMGAPGVRVNLSNDPNAQHMISYLFTTLKHTFRMSSDPQERQWFIRYMKRLNKVLEAEFEGYTPAELYQAVGLSDVEIKTLSAA